MVKLLGRLADPHACTDYKGQNGQIFRKGQVDEIEDLVQTAQREGACPFYLTR